MERKNSDREAKKKQMRIRGNHIPSKPISNAAWKNLPPINVLFKPRHPQVGDDRQIKRLLQASIHGVLCDTIAYAMFDKH
jgi:hypothetical protein